MNVTVLALPLLEYLAYKSGRSILSDLRYLGHAEQLLLGKEVQKIPDHAVSLHEWNDALEYLTDLPPMPTASSAKNCLYRALMHKSHSQTGTTGDRLL